MYAQNNTAREARIKDRGQNIEGTLATILHDLDAMTEHLEALEMEHRCPRHRQTSHPSD